MALAEKSLSRYVYDRNNECIFAYMYRDPLTVANKGPYFENPSL